jgi:hypothetical protein
MMEAVRTSETSVDNHFTRQYIPEDNFDHQSLVILSFEALKCEIAYYSRSSSRY